MKPAKTLDSFRKAQPVAAERKTWAELSPEEKDAVLAKVAESLGLVAPSKGGA